nr:hypothetical protein [Tanacetum cinerariifolium]
MDQNIDSSRFDQIQSPQYPVSHHISQADVEEVLYDKEKFLQDTQTFLEKFNHFSFGFTPRVLTIAWERIDKIKYVLTELEEIPELMYKLCEDVGNIKEELAEYINSLIWNYPIFFYDEQEDYSIQYREYLEKFPDAVTTVLPTEEPEHSLSIGYEHLNTTPKTKSDEIIMSGVEELVPILSEYEVTSEDKREYIEYIEASPLDPELVSLEKKNVEEEEFSLEEENDVYQEEEVDLEDIFHIQDVILRENLLSINRLIANIESLNDNPTPDCVLKSSASFLIFEESDNSISLSNNSSLEFETFSDHTEETRSEVDLFLASDNSIPPGIENFGDDSKGDIRFLEELLIDDSIPFPNNESSNFEDDPPFPCPPSEPPDVEFFFNSKSDVITE